MRIRIPLALMLLLVAVSFSEAEESARGRLADGRAYRTDEEGNQLVDYIAELEVSAEALNRRIVGLEDELAEKGRIIERLNRGESGAAAFSGTLTERTLAGSPNGEAKDSVEDPAITRANREIVRLQRELSESQRTPKQDSSEMNVRNELSKVYATLDSTKGELSSVKAALESERRLRDQDQATYAALSRECSTARTSSQQNCDLEVAAAVREVTSTGVSREAALREESSRERDMQRAELQAVQAERDSLKGELAQISADLRATQSALTAAQGDLQGARSALAAAQVERSAPRGGGQLGDSVFTQRQVVGRDYASRSRSAVVDSIRGTMTSDLNQVRGLVATRDNLFAAAAGRGDQRLQLKPSPLLSTRRRTLNDIAAGIRSAEQVHELTALRSDLTEIRALVQGDIDLLRRTGRAG